MVSGDLPAGWKEMTAADGRKYYANTTTKATSWTKPVADGASSPAPAPAASAAPSPAPAAAAASGDLPAGWKELTAADGRKYYANSTTKATSWTRPTESSSPAPAPAPAAAAAGGEAPLPDGWRQLTAKDGRVYYAHTDKRTSWTRPV